ncbi:MAG: Gfo/Idh/MocA family oxidoreductase [Kiritimatiellales bacterium]|nr:Gfo/Idh/MocA family oxidoreductase [Kiritimatiellales bacterium]
MKAAVNRQNFIKTSTAVAAFNLLPSGVWSKSPNSQLHVACIGCGGKGTVDLKNVAAHEKTEIVALCDPDLAKLSVAGDGKPGKKKRKNKGIGHPDAKRFQDYREMLSTMAGQVDAVIVATPDHAHYNPTVDAMKLGKHVYVQKPLTHEISEAKILAATAKRTGVATQMGTQNQSSLAYRLGNHVIKSGFLGKIKKVYVWSFKNWGYDGAPYTGSDPVPKTLDWNVWLETAPKRPYLEGKYHTMEWRRMIDFGCGTLGDMGVHIYDTPFNALGLEPAEWVIAKCRAPTGFGHPEANRIDLGFAPTELTTKDFTWTWFDGDLSPLNKIPERELLEEQSFPQQGAFVIGEEGTMLLPHVGGPQFYPRKLNEKFYKVKPDLPANVSHYDNWINTILGTESGTTAHFGYASKMVETVLLGVVANRFPGKKLNWNSKAMQFTNSPEATRLVTRNYRNY